MDNETITAIAAEPITSLTPVRIVDTSVHGSVLALIQFDICEEIRLDELRRLLGARKLEASFKHPAPGYVQYQRPPVVEPIEPLVMESGERLEGQIKYYDYGVLSVIFELPFSGDWDTLVRLASRWVWDTDFTSQAMKIAKKQLERAAPALIKPYENWLHEDYFIFHVSEVAGKPTANELLMAHGAQLAQIVRGEIQQLSDGERQEILQGRISYYPTDLAVIGWNATFLYDSNAGAETTIQLLEYANSQLLEFRHYDDLMTHELEGVYDFMEQGRTGLFGRWKMARAANRLHTVWLDVNELAERADNAIKFLSDMFSARLYRLAAAKVGVPDYKTLVNQKLQTAEELYSFMVEQFHQSRAFVLELMVVIILIIDLIFLFRGQPVM
jgi:hypothetical protein